MGDDKFLNKSTIGIEGYPGPVEFKNVTLEQAVGSHHYFSFLWRPGSLSSSLSYQQGIIEKYIGKGISISFDSFRFKGLITSMAVIEEDGAAIGFQVSGVSPTILLDDVPQSTSFYQQSLQTVIQGALQDAGSGLLKTQVVPAHKGTLPYCVQYNETDFDFIARLAARYGEWMYYDGNALVIGEPQKDEVKLTKNVTLHQLKTVAAVTPQRINYVSYDMMKASPLSEKSQKAEAGSHPLMNLSSSASDDLYSSSSQKQTFVHHGYTQDQLKQVKEVQTKVNAAAFVRVSGISELPVMPGQRISIASDTNQSAYTVISATHYADTPGNYHCSFTAIPADVKVPPYSNPHLVPKADMQSAIVKDNNDPEKLGRVRVQFFWQQQNDMSPWVRQASPAAGGGTGFHFVPEVGEEVVIGFEGGNAEMPVVLGSKFNGKSKSGYGDAQNNMKAIKTRSGNLIQLDDNSGSVTVTDKNGSTMIMDGSGNITVQSQTLVTVKTDDKIVVDAPNQIEFLSKEIHLKGTKKVVIGEGPAQITIDNVENKITTGADKLETSAVTLHELKSKANMRVETKHHFTDVETHAIKSMNFQLDGKTVTDIKGGTVNLNC
ncbi:type VI secretion system Vgr family protein [Chitinophaga qingshengii]|uniref:Type VI secretion system tip protein VgrG n=1 Tax=Chitinophaga qingshengii TaxID=1569794 RepID=A0ABR7TKY7_9BACT|nr:type VI secretion system tip protein VgrG [Chitinophaga qingshengii]MBC9930208.1 type VI secretion system tip protein VgrG [Chitinophaga qingshengii]